MQRILSGVQPTGSLHLGNYLGALQQWVKLQYNCEALFCVVDYHAITVLQSPRTLKESIYQTIAAYLACGIDPSHSTIFVQSHVSAHTELAWILSCFTPLGWLNRMTQFKEKAGKHKEESKLALYSYPVLMAADILLYRATHVPVGDDQTQHLELARDLASLCNRSMKQTLFVEPELLKNKVAARVMSLRDGKKKMSKSALSPMSRIHLLDSNDEIVQKIKKAKSDSIQGMSYDPVNRPEASNLLMILSAITGESMEKILLTHQGIGFSQFKLILAEALIAHLAPIRNQMIQYLNDKAMLDKLLTNGALKANEIAKQQLKKVKQAIGVGLE